MNRHRPSAPIYSAKTATALASLFALQTLKSWNPTGREPGQKPVETILLHLLNAVFLEFLGGVDLGWTQECAIFKTHGTILFADGTIGIAAPDITLDLQGFSITSSGNWPLIEANQAQSVVIRNGHLQGGSHGIIIHLHDRGGHVRLKQLMIDQADPFGIMIKGHSTVDGSTVSILDCQVRSRGKGIYIEDVSGGILQGNHVEGEDHGTYIIRANGLRIEDNTSVGRTTGMLVAQTPNTRVTDNIVRGEETGLSVSNAPSNLVDHNSFEADQRADVNVFNSVYGSYRWNTFKGAPLVAISIYGVTPVIRDCRFLGGKQITTSGQFGGWHDAGGNVLR